MAQSMKGLLLMSLVFQGAGLFIKWRGWLHRVEGGLEGVRVFTFSLLLPSLLFRSTWAAALEPSLVLWFFWAVGFHALWTATTFAAYAYGHGLEGRDLGWSLLMSNGVALGFAYSLLSGSDDAQAIPAALAYDIGGNLWMCQVVNGWIAHRYRPLDREAFDDRGYRIAESAEAAENPLVAMTEMAIMAGESEECAPRRPRSLSWSGDSRGALMMARHALDQNNLALMTNGHSVVTVDLARGRSLLSLDLPRDDLKKAFDADAAPEPTCGPRTLGSKLLLRNIIVHAFFLGLVFNAAVPCRGAFADASLALGSAFAPVMFVLIGLSAPSPGALAREVRDVSAVVATRSLVQVALVLLNPGPWSGPARRRRCATRSRSARCRPARTSASSVGSEYHDDGTKRTVAALNVTTAFVLTTAYVHVAT